MGLYGAGLLRGKKGGKSGETDRGGPTAVADPGWHRCGAVAKAAL